MPDADQPTAALRRLGYEVPTWFKYEALADWLRRAVPLDMILRGVLADGR